MWAERARLSGAWTMRILGLVVLGLAVYGLVVGISHSEGESDVLLTILALGLPLLAIAPAALLIGRRIRNRRAWSVTLAFAWIVCTLAIGFVFGLAVLFAVYPGS